MVPAPTDASSPAPLVSVVIPGWKGLAHLPACLDSLRAQTLQDFEVVLVDNASPDGLGDWAAREHPWVRLVRNPRNLGFAGGTNAGIRAARGRYIVTLNQDLTAEPRFLEALVQALVEAVRAQPPDRKVGMVASKMLYFHDRRVVNSAGIEVLRDFFGEDRGSFEADGARWDEPGEVFGPCGGAALYDRAMLDEIGLFDEDFFCYFEDVDLAWRARLAGWRCVYAPSAVVHHKHRGSAEQLTRADDTPKHVQAWCNRNRVWMVLKNAGAGTLLLRFPLLVARELAEVAEAAKHRDAYKLRAQFEALRALEPTLAKRRQVQKLRRIPDREVMRWMRKLPGLGAKAPAQTEQLPSTTPVR